MAIEFEEVRFAQFLDILSRIIGLCQVFDQESLKAFTHVQYTRTVTIR